MRFAHASSGVLAAAVLSATAVACSPSPTEPSRPTVSPAGPFLSRIEVSGPNQVDPGGTGQFTATAHYSDGTSRNVTNEATWSSSDNSVVWFSTGGTARGIRNGEARAVASMQGRSGSTEVMVIPAGTFKLTVRVLAAGTSGPSLSDAAVTVLTEDGSILPTESRIYYGVRGKTEVITTYPPFYEPDVRSIDVAEHQKLDVALTLSSNPGVNVTGTYTVTLEDRKH